MRRKRQRLSVTLTVLAFGLIVGWIAGERVPPATAEAALAQAVTAPADEAVVTASQHVEIEVVEVAEADRDGQAQVRHRRVIAFRMPYFSFHAMLPRPSSRVGVRP